MHLATKTFLTLLLCSVHAQNGQEGQQQLETAKKTIELGQVADTCKLASCSDAKRPHRGRSYRVALFSINGVGALMACATLLNQCMGALAAHGSSQNSNN